MAALYVLLDAQFLAVAQVLVYAGAILVLFTFVIMLLDLRASDIEGRTKNVFGVFLGVAAALGLLCVLAGSLRNARMPGFPALQAGQGTVEAIARVLLVDFLLPFEAASVLLLIATVGSVWIARREDT